MIPRPNAAAFIRAVVHNGRDCWRADLPPHLAGGDRLRRHFKTRDQAEAFVRRFLAEARQIGPDLAGEVRRLPGSEQTELLALLRDREQRGLSLADYRRALAERQPPLSDITLAALGPLCLEDARRRNLRPMTLRNLADTWRGFSANRGELRLADVTPELVAAFVDGNGWAPATRRSKLSELRMCFAFAVRAKLIRQNPAAAVAPPRVDKTECRPLSVDDARRLLEACQRTDPAFLPFIVLQLFCGIRRGELLRLDAGALVDGEIRIGAEQAKTRSARIVPVSPQAAAWLDIASAAGGALCPDHARARWRRVRLAAGFRQRDWPHNTLRHSFCSYHVAAYDNPALTAALAGHDQAMLFRNYRRVVRKNDALAFFGLLPDPALVAEGRGVARFKDAVTRQRRREAALCQWARRRAKDGPAVAASPAPSPATPVLAGLGGASMLPAPCPIAPST